VAVLSHNIGPYEEALEGYREYLKEQGIGANIKVVGIQGDAGKAKEAMEESGRQGSNLILALGSVAAGASKGLAGKLPVVIGLVLDSSEISANGGTAGATIDIPMEAHLQWMKKILPAARNVGLMYSPEKNTQKAETASSLAKSYGLNLIAYRVDKPSDIPEALDTLSRKVDVFLGIVDELVYTQQTAKHILLFSLKNRIPFVGLSEAWVKAGALYSLDCDYRDIGVQCAELTISILRTRKADPAKTLGPRRIVYSLNSRTASLMKIDLSESTVQGAHEVFR